MAPPCGATPPHQPQATSTLVHTYMSCLLDQKGMIKKESQQTEQSHIAPIGRPNIPLCHIRTFTTIICQFLPTMMRILLTASCFALLLISAMAAPTSALSANSLPTCGLEIGNGQRLDFSALHLTGSGEGKGYYKATPSTYEFQFNVCGPTIGSTCESFDGEKNAIVCEIDPSSNNGFPIVVARDVNPVWKYDDTDFPPTIQYSFHSGDSCFMEQGRNRTVVYNFVCDVGSYFLFHNRYFISDCFYQNQLPKRASRHIHLSVCVCLLRMHCSHITRLAYHICVVVILSLFPLSH